MAKQKRGGFSFFDTKSSKAKKRKKVVPTVTAVVPAVRFIENKAESQNIQRYIDGAKACIGEVSDSNKVEFSQVYKGPHLHRYFYIYFHLNKDEIENVLTALSVKFKNSIECKSIIITYVHNALTRILVAPPQLKETSKLQDIQYDNPQKAIEKKTGDISSIEVTGKVEVEQSPEKKIRIDINMDDIDEFLDYLENRVPDRHTRDRFVDSIKSFYANGWNQYRHSTFIDDNKYKVNTKDVEIFVNGMKSRDFDIKAKEYEDALELYLSYRWAKDYSKPIKDVKDEAIQPKFKERPKKKVKEKEDAEGKKIFVNIEHLESWKSSMLNEEPEKNVDSNSNKGIVYLGEPEGQRKSASIQNANITEGEQSVDISINLNTNEIQDDVEAANNVTEIDEVKETVPIMEHHKKKKSNSWLANMMLKFWKWLYRIV